MQLACRTSSPTRRAGRVSNFPSTDNKQDHVVEVEEDDLADVTTMYKVDDFDN